MEQLIENPGHYFVFHGSLWRLPELHGLHRGRIDVLPEKVLVGLVGIASGRWSWPVRLRSTIPVAHRRIRLAGFLPVEWRHRISLRRTCCLNLPTSSTQKYGHRLVKRHLLEFRTGCCPRWPDIISSRQPKWQTTSVCSALLWIFLGNIVVYCFSLLS